MADVDYETWVGRTAYDADQGKLGTITDLYVDDEHNEAGEGRPNWAAVSAGHIDKHTYFVPLKFGEETDDGIAFTLTTSEIAAAPTARIREELSDEQEVELFEYYQQFASRAVNYEAALASLEAGRVRLRQYFATDELFPAEPESTDKRPDESDA